MLTKEQQEALERLKADLAAALDIPVAYVNVYAGDLRTLLSLTEAPEAESLTAAEKLSTGLKETFARTKSDDSLTTVHQRLVAQEVEAVEPAAGEEDTLEAMWRAAHKLHPHPPTIQADLDRAVEALRDLAALVRGECPSLLNEDSGGDASLSARIDETLATITKGQKP